MNYAEMTDAELDALVAERVMKWERQLNDVWCTPDGWLPVTWSPTTDANARDEVVKKMAPTHAVHIETCTTDGRLWVVDMYPRDTRYDYGGANELPLGRAVCIAALRAVEE